MAHLRAPSTHPSTPPSASIPAPLLSWLRGTWHVTHSTLPMWKKARNVRITYTPIPNSNSNSSTAPVPLDDEVSYQALASPAIKTVRGVDRPFDVRARVARTTAAPPPPPAVRDNVGDCDGDGDGGALASLGYNWRGKGWLVIASSKWEILGYGDEEGTDGNAWVVTYFAKTLFTPAGVDLYSRKGALKPETIESLKQGLVGLGGELEKLAGELFEVKMDGGRTD